MFTQTLQAPQPRLGARGTLLSDTELFNDEPFLEAGFRSTERRSRAEAGQRHDIRIGEIVPTL
jgi:hypothetical protein